MINAPGGVTGEPDLSEMEPRLNELEFALQDAGAMVLDLRERGLAAVQKSGNPTDIVTEADTASELLLTTAIRRLFPDHAVRGEEGTRVNGRSPYEWIIDPVDGTKPCREGGTFGISVGLTYEGRPLFGMILYPAEGKILKAVRGRGATLNGRPVRVSGAAALAETRAGFDHSSSGDHDEQKTRLRDPLERAAVSVRNYWCATKAVLDILEGNTEAYVCAGATPYDLAAALVIAEEAGCAIAALDGTVDLSRDFTPIAFAQNQRLLAEIRRLYAA